MIYRSHTNYALPVPWIPPNTSSSMYQTNAFAQSLFQRTAPSMSYPTPPPPGIVSSSSSLAYALGDPIPKSTPAAPKQDSSQFFNDFLTQKTCEIHPTREIGSVRPTTPPRITAQAPQESPDPLALGPASAVFNSPFATPRKRKADIHAESPSVKRVQSISSYKTPHIPISPLTPLSSQKSTIATPTSKSKRLQPYIEVPPLPKSWFTPSQSGSGKSITSLSKKMQGKLKVDDTPDDLGGYGSVDEDDYLPRRHGDSSIKSSARRTGDRDERGMCFKEPTK